MLAHPFFGTEEQPFLPDKVENVSFTAFVLDACVKLRIF
jgi:hypothetical protein